MVSPSHVRWQAIWGPEALRLGAVLGLPELCQNEAGSKQASDSGTLALHCGDPELDEEVLDRPRVVGELDGPRANATSCRNGAFDGHPGFEARHLNGRCPWDGHGYAVPIFQRVGLALKPLDFTNGRLVHLGAVEAEEVFAAFRRNLQRFGLLSCHASQGQHHTRRASDR